MKKFVQQQKTVREKKRLWEKISSELAWNKLKWILLMNIMQVMKRKRSQLSAKWNSQREIYSANFIWIKKKNLSYDDVTRLMEKKERKKKVC